MTTKAWKGKSTSRRSTDWSLVHQALGPSSERRRTALNELMTVWLPRLKYHLVVRRGVDQDEADDFVQGFVTNRLISGDLLHRADRCRGGFGNFLLTALDNYVFNQWRERAAKKRRSIAAVNCEIKHCEHRVSTEVARQTQFETAWARDVLWMALARMHCECLLNDRMDVWDVFDGRLVAPLLDGAKRVPYERIQSRLGLTSTAQSQNLLVTAKRMFQRTLRCLIRDFGVEEQGITSEIHDVVRFLRH